MIYREITAVWSEINKHKCTVWSVPDHPTSLLLLTEYKISGEKTKGKIRLIGVRENGLFNI